MALLSLSMYIINFLHFLLIFEIQIQMLPDESIVKVTGYTSPIANREAVRSLKFTTSMGRVLGPYPPIIKEENFNLPIEGGREVVGFKGVTDGILSAIGVHSVPRNN